MIQNKAAQAVRSLLNDRALLEQLAEESMELGKAALKRIRAENMSGNPTLTRAHQAQVSMEEEIKDVVSVLHLLYPDNPRYDWIDNYPKYERWAMRIAMYGHGEESDFEESDLSQHNTDNRIGRLIQERLDELGMTRRELASAVHIADVSLHRIINGERMPSLPVQRNIAKVLGLTWEKILCKQEGE